MRRILTTTAIAALTAMPLHAEEHGGANEMTEAQVTAGEQEFRASNLMGATVYMPGESDSASVENVDPANLPEGWTEIGSVEDVFVDNNGEIATVVMSPNDQTQSDRDRIGVETASVNFKTSGDGNEILVVYTGDKVSLENAGEFQEASARAEGQTSARDMEEQRQADAGESQDEMEQQRQADASGSQNEMSAEDRETEARMANSETEKDGLKIRAADLSGHPVYIPEEGANADEMSGEVAEAPDSWEQVGEIGNVVLSREGEIQSITLDAGGFLGMGEKEVETSMDDLRFVRDSDADADNEWFVVFTGDRAQLEDQEEFDRDRAQREGRWVLSPGYDDRARNTGTSEGMSSEQDQTSQNMSGTEGEQRQEDAASAEGAMTDDGQEQDMAQSGTQESSQEEDMAASEDARTGEEQDGEQMAQTEASDGASQEEDMAANDDGMTGEAEDEQTAANEEGTTGEAEDEQMADAGAQGADEGSGPMNLEEMSQLTASELEGQTVYGSNGDSIGDVSTLVLDDGGEIDRVVVDVGGFLGIGEKPVALPFDELQIEQNGDGMNSIDVTTDHTQEELESMETWQDA
jgi:sporulation protein YlmC with PRC-barrel domain